MLKKINLRGNFRILREIGAINDLPRYLIRVGDTICKTIPCAEYNEYLHSLNNKQVHAVIKLHFGKPVIYKISLTN